MNALQPKINQTAPIFSLPNELLLHIIESLRDPRDIARAAQTCRRFYGLVYPAINISNQPLNLRHISYLSPHLIKRLRSFLSQGIKELISTYIEPDHSSISRNTTQFTLSPRGKLLQKVAYYETILYGFLYNNAHGRHFNIFDKVSHPYTQFLLFTRAFRIIRLLELSKILNRTELLHKHVISTLFQDHPHCFYTIYIRLFNQLKPRTCGLPLNQLATEPFTYGLSDLPGDHITSILATLLLWTHIDRPDNAYLFIEYLNLFIYAFAEPSKTLTGLYRLITSDNLYTHTHASLSIQWSGFQRIIGIPRLERKIGDWFYYEGREILFFLCEIDHRVLVDLSTATIYLKTLLAAYMLFSAVRPGGESIIPEATIREFITRTLNITVKAHYEELHKDNTETKAFSASAYYFQYVYLPVKLSFGQSHTSYSSECEYHLIGWESLTPKATTSARRSNKHKQPERV